MKPVFWGLMSLVLFLGATQECKADYIFTTLDVPGATSTGASGINDLGQIVGGYSNPDTTGHGFLLSSGGYTTLDVPDGRTTNPRGINASGQIVGYYQSGIIPLRAFLLSESIYTTARCARRDIDTSLGHQ
jgi:probable HAF family extracellular repeat protein